MKPNTLIEDKRGAQKAHEVCKMVLKYFFVTVVRQAGCLAAELQVFKILKPGHLLLQL